MKDQDGKVINVDDTVQNMENSGNVDNSKSELEVQKMNEECGNAASVKAGIDGHETNSVVRNEVVKENDQKWSPDMNMQKVEPSKMPVWVKMVDIPLEAWSVEGISALASSIGMPFLMDTVTAAMCHKGMGNLGYARVLVEIPAEKGLKKSIEIQYRDKNQCVKGTKSVQVVYDWIPHVCEHCKVFGHSYLRCSKRPKSAEELENDAKGNSNVVNENQKNNGIEEKTEWENQGRKRFNKNQNYQSNYYRNGTDVGKSRVIPVQSGEGMRNQKGENGNFARQEYRKKQDGNVGKSNEKNEGIGTSKQGFEKAKIVMNNERSSNQYSVLSSLPEDDTRVESEENNKGKESQKNDDDKGIIEDVEEVSNGIAEVMKEVEVNGRGKKVLSDN
ncbi:hypothetical protein CTI12_AA007890 [Artemisia annua]|uniref:Uncharacterized protein n=1 Tax=Artemisia annua TaxID=35608 RepID=A0A2U1Q0W7_ARTAN|nr:hypothetical protein CTI12_AA007890 [Artemisia annua]